MARQITIEGYRIDLDQLYGEMVRQGERLSDGQLVFKGRRGRALKHLLHEQFDVPLGHDGRQVRWSVRDATVKAMKELGWVAKPKPRSSTIFLLRDAG